MSSAARSPLHHFFVSLSRYFDIVCFKTYANLKRDIDKTYLGAFWWVLEPLLTTAIYCVVVGFMMKTRSSDIVLTIFVGNVIYGHFSGAINFGSNAIIGASGLLQQIQLPKILYPIIAICNLSWKFLFSLLVIFPLLWLLGALPSWSYLALPLLLILQLYIVIAITLPLAILMPYFQDGRTLLSTLLTVLLWASGVLYDTSKVPEHWRFWFFLNPAADLIESYRNILIHHAWPNWNHLATAFLLCTVIGAYGVHLINRLSGKVAKLPL